MPHLVGGGSSPLRAPLVIDKRGVPDVPPHLRHPRLRLRQDLRAVLQTRGHGLDAFVFVELGAPVGGGRGEQVGAHIQLLKLDDLRG
jgi:hypothetical protein